jgi:hypothetical protein
MPATEPDVNELWQETATGNIYVVTRLVLARGPRFVLVRPIGQGAAPEMRFEHSEFLTRFQYASLSSLAANIVVAQNIVRLDILESLIKASKDHPYVQFMDALSPDYRRAYARFVVDEVIHRESEDNQEAPSLWDRLEND